MSLINRFRSWVISKSAFKWILTETCRKKECPHFAFFNFAVNFFNVQGLKKNIKNLTRFNGQSEKKRYYNNNMIVYTIIYVLYVYYLYNTIKA